MLFIDKYNVEQIEDVVYNKEIYNLTSLLAKNNTVPHLIVSGDAGVGKKSLVNYYIKEKFGLERVKTSPKNISIKCSNKDVDFSFMFSNYHYLIEPSKYGVYDKQIIQYMLNDILKYRPINKTDYHLIVVNNADRLTVEAQQSLRRTLEKFISNCRFIFIVNCNSSMIDPIRSRCLVIKLNAPTKLETHNMLTKIANNENIQISSENLDCLIDYNDNNLKESVNQLQLLSTFKVNLMEPGVIARKLFQNDNCYIIARFLLVNAGRQIVIADLICDLRKMTQELLIECVDPILIVKRIFRHLFNYTSNLNNDDLSCKLVGAANHYINGLKNCNKPIYYIEGFCLQVYSYLDSTVVASQVSNIQGPKEVISTKNSPVC